MNEKIFSSEERVLTAISHREPDRIPFDIGSTVVGGITMKAYRGLLDILGFEEETIEIEHISQQLAKVNEDMLTRLNVDTRGFQPMNISIGGQEIKKQGDYYVYKDEFGIIRSMPVEGGYYYDMTFHPLAGELTMKRISDYQYPDHRNWVDIEKLRRDIVDKHKETRCAIVLRGSSVLVERVLFLRGFADGLMDFAGGFNLLCALMDKIVENTLLYWEKVLDGVGDIVDVIALNEDLGGQESPLISPTIYRKYVKPRHKEIFSFVKRKAPQAKLFLHSCGSVYDLIGDLVEIGVDILNPVQVRARNMDTKKLKKEFGKDLVFWGGGVDTQEVLPYGTPDDVRDEVKRRIDDLAPDGGFVFNTIHNIQADVPTENIIAMWETVMEYGKY